MVMIGSGSSPWKAALQANAAAAGPTASVMPAISGASVVGQKLSCSNGTWKRTGSISYVRQWTRGGLAISGAKGTSYVLVLADAGAVVGCNVTATDSTGSTPVAATGAKTVVHVAPVAAGTLAAQSFTQYSGVKTYNVAGGFAGQALTFSLVAPPAGVTISSAGVVSVDTSIAGLLQATTVTVRASNSGGAATSGSSLTITAVPVPAVATVPVISGTGKIGSLQTGIAATWTIVPDQLENRWTLNGGVISGATGINYTPVAANDQGGLRYQQRARKTNGAWSAWTQSGLVTITHVAPVAAGSLSAQSFTEKTGVKTYNASVGFSGQALAYALISPPAGISIAPATGIVSIDTGVTGVFPGTPIRVRATNSGGSLERTFGLSIAAALIAPVNSIAPAIGGSFVVGQTLTVSNGTWTPAPSAYAYQWTRAGADISGATASSYTTALADEAKSLGCRVVASNVAGSSAPVLATGSRSVVRVAPGVAATLPALSFTEKSGVQTCDVSGGFTGQALSFALVSPPAGVTISAAGVVSIDTGTTGLLAGVSVTVRATNSGGSATSGFALTVKTVPVPIVATVPAISGAGKIGAAQVATPAVWTTAPDEVESRWLVAGIATSATGMSYMPVAADDRKTLTFEQRARKTGGAWSVWAASAPVTITHVAPVAAGSLSPQNFTEKTGVKTYDASVGFTGQALVYMLISPPAGVSIATATGVVSVDTDASGLLPNATVTIQATNSGGQATGSFPLGVAAAAAWSVLGDVGRIIVAAAPAITGPVATGSTGQLTITA